MEQIIFNKNGTYINIKMDLIPNSIKEAIKKEFKTIKIVKDERVKASDMEWYKETEKNITPGDAMKIYRENHGFTQEQLGKKIGKFSRQNISAMERGEKAISKETAKKLSSLFSTSVENFI